MVARAGRVARRRGVGALAAVMAVLALGLGAAPAGADTSTPEWALTAVPTPTRLVPESPRTEVDRLVVDATGGTYRLDFAFQDKPLYTARLPYDATALEVQNAMNEIVRPIGAGSVAVAAEAGGATTHVYTIHWEGNAVDHSLLSLLIEGIGGEEKDLTGGASTVAYTPVTRGVNPGQIVVTATNVGNASTSGPITVSDVVPAGLTVTAVQGTYPYGGFGASMECQAPPAVSCSWNGPVLPGGVLTVTITVEVAGGLPASVDDEASVSGGGVAAAQRSAAIPVSAEPAPFGVAPGSLLAALSSQQAGAHPNITTAFAFSTQEPDTISAAPKDVRFDLPVGLVGNTVGMPRCSMHGVISSLFTPEACPADSMVGVAVVTLSFATGQAGSFPTGIYNIAPAPGEPAAFGFDALVVPVRLDTSVLSNGNYGVRVTTSDINEGAQIVGVSITMWGVPTEHDGPGEGFLFAKTFGGASSAARVPLLTNPQQCSQELGAAMSTDSWVQPGAFVPSEAVSLGTMSGCDQLRLSSSFTMVPDTLEAGAPAGYHFDLSVPQNNAPNGLATPNVRDVTVKLPLGTVVNPSAAWGLKACSHEQFYGPNHPSQEPAGLAGCPRQAQVGTVWIKTPALEEALEGQVFLAEPECDPCSPEDAEDGRMVKLYVQAVSEGEGGIVIKLEGRGMIDQSTGQITTVFEDNPQLPFDRFKLKLAGGPRAVLANPRQCGSVASSMDLVPWSSPFTPDSISSYGFEINQNCFGAQFAPSFKAGMPNIQAGEHGEFTLAFGRQDDDEFLGGIETHLPEGLLGTLAGVELCKEPQAGAGRCGQGSLIGTVQALTGPGADPFLVSGGRVFLTEGYSGAPYGLSIVVPAAAGPYTLSGTTGEGTVVVRAQIYIDPHTAALTVRSSELPHMLDGIPLQLKAVNVRIDRPGFMFNPTSCAKTAITGTLAAVEGLTAEVRAPFQVTDCRALEFKPRFTASTSAKTSRAKGASLHVAINYPSAGEANIKQVHVELPKALPSRLSTLQQACPEATFAASPASCPAASVVGTAIAHTPVLSVPLQGPAYFVSHGGAKFPELILVLQGQGVTIVLQGETFISKAGVTSSTFRAVPDAPVSSFELTLPEGKDSALAAPGNKLCGMKLAMPTTITAQSGKQITQDTQIKVTGCKGTSTRKKHQKKHQKKHRKKKHEKQKTHGKKHRGHARRKRSRGRAIARR